MPPSEQANVIDFSVGRDFWADFLGSRGGRIGAQKYPGRSGRGCFVCMLWLLALVESANLAHEPVKHNGDVVAGAVDVHHHIRDDAACVHVVFAHVAG